MTARAATEVECSRRAALGRLATVAGGALFGAAACGPIEAVRAPREGYAKAEREVMRAVLSARRSGLVFHHLGPALRPFASNAEIVYARSHEPDPHDVVFGYDQLLDRWIQEMHRARETGTVLMIPFVDVQVQQNRAKLIADLRIMRPSGTVLQREEYSLWRDRSEWLITAARWYPLELAVGTEKIRFSAFEWRRRDARIKEAREMGDTASLVDALREARRWPEAHDELITWTRQSTKSMPAKQAAALWRLRGEVALEAGRARDTLPSFKQAVALDASVALPDLKAAEDARAGR
ncbi:MAG: hypothetical protein H6747_05275 [Deltaproteobacteria bacterium]|nr:hypothetical protein [Deltaproteobacteria bacterium]